ncbi:MAG: hypothetical protein JNJ48_02020 [Phycisphaerae bacterium]|nr:hypothetical protein [Phycisphaerae bacterium]
MRAFARTQLVASIALAVSLAASGLLTVRIASSAGRNQLTYTGKAEEGMTREEALGVALGAFRGLFVNWLWIRANELKEAGKYYEAVDLARSITRLQPRFPRVWAFHAWNLAYNISVATQTAGERWQWVNAGIRLLRDEGIPANPADLLLHKELAWIFLHKVQGVMDDANNVYKRELAREWTIALGPPPPRTKETRTVEAITARHVEWLSRIAAGRNTIEEVLQANPQAGLLVERLKSEAGLDPTTLNGRLEILRHIEESRSAVRKMEAFGIEGQFPGGLNPGLMRLLTDASLRPGWEALSPYLRKRLLIDHYHMEPERMVRFTQKYGPIDWRHPCAHSLYWAARGVEEALTRLNEYNERNMDFVNTDRLVLQSLQELRRGGQVMYDILLPDMYVQIPNGDFIKSYEGVIEELMEREADQMALQGADMKRRVFRFYAAAYENFLSDALAFLYRRGQVEEAKRYQRKLATWEGRNLNDLEQDRIRKLPIDEYILQNLKERMTDPSVARSEVWAGLFGAYLNGLYVGDEELFRSQFNYAQMVHRTYMDEQLRRTTVDLERGRMEVMDRDFRVEASRAFVAIAGALSPFDSALMFQRTPNDLRLAIYYLMDRAKMVPMKEDGTPATPELAKLFPTPPDYAAYRAARDAQEAARRAQDKANQDLK